MCVLCINFIVLTSKFLAGKEVQNFDQKKVCELRCRFGWWRCYEDNTRGRFLWSISSFYMPKMFWERIAEKGTPLTNRLVVFSNFKYLGQPQHLLECGRTKKVEFEPADSLHKNWLNYTKKHNVNEDIEALYQLLNSCMLHVTKKRFWTHFTIQL